ncbi:nuclear transport factor 2 family protein [Nocardia cyriacigeorgica]|uniref:nuclear transport factor 2 family protein n=1 Tax=Nocardia cyriacigeorgica TaxID=135487 RepID=UPI001894ED59|nr:nuclear transport factor 2 family protein [Nocardia cyriacigeorgica]MBF6090083.1 nuclear transport factor 2 family protein [Nocardia cyriacigeorgica]MBF6095980.1 nuclear transport factor 2 family protein [Nocardia cyriacigeorgica]
MSVSPSPETLDADLARRLARMEAVESIKALKHRYFRACDAKDPKGFRDCFIAAGSALDYGELGAFDADGMAAVFESIALKQVDGKHVILDMHHGLHPDITIIDDTTASGRWTLQFRQVNLVEKTETVSTGEYTDEYVIEDGTWKIATCRFDRIWSITRPIGDSCRVTQ